MSIAASIPHSPLPCALSRVPCREIADHHSLDDDVYGCPREPEEFRCGDTVFMHRATGDFSSWLANEHQRVRFPYIVLSCSMDSPVPYASAITEWQRVASAGPGAMPKLWAWFGQNVGAASGHVPRARSVPTGFPPHGWEPGQ